MSCDSHYIIGHSHRVCQDYSASGDGICALSDGCSNVLNEDGKPINAHTDFGARLLVRAAFQHSQPTGMQCDLFHHLVIHTADGYRRQLGLDRDSLAATLLTLSATNLGIQATIAGDGVLAGRYREQPDKWDCVTYRYDSNPYYLRYLLDGRYSPRVQATEVFRNERLVTGGPTCSSLWYQREYDLVVCVSDGAFSFTKNSAVVPFDKELATRLLDFRRLKGEFVKRHLTGVLKEMAQDGFVNQDDISMIAIHL